MKMMPNSDGNSVKNSVALMDGRNGGKLRRGNPGNAGRSRSRIKAASALAYEERIPILTAIADNEDEKSGDRIRATEVLGKAGGIMDGRERLDEDLAHEMAAVAGEVLKRLPDGDELLNQLYEAWKPVIARRL